MSDTSRTPESSPNSERLLTSEQQGVIMEVTAFCIRTGIARLYRETFLEVAQDMASGGAYEGWQEDVAEIQDIAAGELPLAFCWGKRNLGLVPIHTRTGDLVFPEFSALPLMSIEEASGSAHEAFRVLDEDAIGQARELAERQANVGLKIVSEVVDETRD